MKLGLSPEQIAERRLGIGGSDAGRVMRGDWLTLWKEKTGRAQTENLSGNLAVQMGNFTENLNAFWFSKVTGRDIAERGARVQCRFNPFMIANLDGISTTAQGKPAYWDAKHVGRSDEAMILRYTPQMVHCATILRLDWWVLSVFVGNGKHEIIEQEVDPFYAEELIAQERRFWGHVERDEEPTDPVEPTLAPKPERVLRTVILDGGQVDAEGVWTAPQALRDFNPERVAAWPNWGADFARGMATILRTQGAATANAIARDSIKKMLPDDVGEVRRGPSAAKRDKAGAVRFTLPKEKGDG